MDSAARITLDDIDIDNVAANRDVWERVVRKMRAGMMPPNSLPRPDKGSYDGFIAYVENELDRSAELYAPMPGMHRLNRTEYANAIRDLLGLDIDPAVYLPSDDSSYGFDNMAGTLTLSSTLVEAYVSAAGKISRLAVGRATTPTTAIYRVPEDTTQDYHVEGLPFGTRGGLIFTHIFPSDGEYDFRIRPVFADNMAGAGFGSIGGEKVIVLVDDERVGELDWAGRGDLTLRIPVQAGPHSIGVTFLATNFAPVLDMNQRFMRSTLQTGPTPGLTFFPHIGAVQIGGPHNSMTARSSVSRDVIFSCRPAAAAEEAACARSIVSNLADRAFRGRAVAEDVDRLMAFYQDGRQLEDFDHGIEMALARILASPKFLYRMEELQAATPNQVEYYRIGDLELASRLSFFLWSTGPDEELLALARQGRLSDPQVLEQQVQRMLQHPKAEALAVNFAGQWLQLRGMLAAAPLPHLYPDFDNNLRQSMIREVELLFDSIVREDRNVVELLTADYTFLDERLARHYGIPNIYGSSFQRVTLGPEMDVRRGLLGKGAILTTTSKPERTSPVTRGNWIITFLLGVRAPDPPPEVPMLPPQAADARGNIKEPTMREKMLQHRVDTACTQCHVLMDPLGFALENFDGIARWRNDDDGRPIIIDDPEFGRLYDGTRVTGPADLRQWLVGYSDQFVQVMVEKLLTYSLGRGVEYQDMPVVRAIRREAAQQDNRFSAIVMGIVKSDTFQMNMKESD